MSRKSFVAADFLRLLVLRMLWIDLIDDIPIYIAQEPPEGQSPDGSVGAADRWESGRAIYTAYSMIGSAVVLAVVAAWCASRSAMRFTLRQ